MIISNAKYTDVNKKYIKAIINGVPVIVPKNTKNGEYKKIISSGLNITET
jgi:hypothetical protein